MKNSNGKPFILGVIPARGGSKGLIEKNIRPLMGKPVIAYTIEAAQKSKYLTYTVVSTDDSEISRIALEHGANVPFTRPSELAEDDSPMVPVLRHAVEIVEDQKDRTVDIVVLLQPTSPLRATEDIDACITRFLDLNPEVLFSALRSEANPYYNLVENRPNTPWIKLCKKPKKVLNYRQEAPPIWTSHGAVIVYDRKALFKYDHHLRMQETAIFEMPEERILDIDSERDLVLAEFLLRDQVSKMGKLTRIDPQTVSVSPVTAIREVMELFNKSQKGFALVTDPDGKYEGTVTDGDIRRSLLKGATLSSPIRTVMRKDPIVVPDSVKKNELLSIMQANSVRHLPIVDDTGRVVALQYLNILTQDENDIVTAVVMAGGRGERLRPLTEQLPKPMLPIGDRPILEILLDALKLSGIKRVLISVGYMKETIQNHFGDGSRNGLAIHYLVESKPLGTAGALGVIPDHLKPSSPFLVINGDLLTRLNFSAFRDFHTAAEYDFTLCCRPHHVSIPFGYPVLEGDLVKGFREKPTFNYLVNSGIYCLSPEIIEAIPLNTHYNMTDLIENICKTERRIGVFPLPEPFHEIGRVESYHAAEAFYSEHFEKDFDYQLELEN